MFNFHTKAALELLLDTSPLSVNLTIDDIGVRAGGGCSPPKFWATQIFWATREIWVKPVFKEASIFF